MEYVQKLLYVWCTFFSKRKLDVFGNIEKHNISKLQSISFKLSDAPNDRTCFTLSITKAWNLGSSCKYCTRLRYATYQNENVRWGFVYLLQYFWGAYRSGVQWDHVRLFISTKKIIYFSFSENSKCLLHKKFVSSNRIFTPLYVLCPKLEHENIDSLNSVWAFLLQSWNIFLKLHFSGQHETNMICSVHVKVKIKMSLESYLLK